MTIRKSTAWQMMAGTVALVLAGVAGSVSAQPAPGGPGMMNHGDGMGKHEGGMRGGPGGMPHEGMGMHGGMGMRMEHMLRAAGATPEQRTKVHQIMKAARDDMHKEKEAGRGMHQQMAQLMTAPKVDAAAVEALRQKMSAHHDAVSKRMTQAMLDAGAVLSPEQRQRMADVGKARKDMMERHRKEREALDPARRN
jgi:Spy/CpxP family protein refolding chaperone